MFGPIRAVIIDDKPSHLFTISSGFSEAGIPITTYWYDESGVRPSQKLKPTPPEGGHEYLRIIFTDLNLEEIHGGLAEVIGPVVNVISQLVSVDGGPYAIVFWTAMKFDIEEITHELNQRLEATGVPLPMIIDEIDKGPFIELPDNDLSGEDVLVDLFSKTYSKAPSLKDEVNRVVKKHGLLQMTSEWESRAIQAAGRSTNNLYSASKIAATEDKDITDSLRMVSGLIAKEAAGQSGANNCPAKAYDVAMQDILVDSFNQSVNDVDYSALVKDEIGETIANGLEINNKESIYSHLNTMFHIDGNVEETTAVDRGAVIDLAEANKNGIYLDIGSFCCWEDFFWQPSESNIGSELPKISDSMRKSLIEEITTISNKAVAAVSSAINVLRKKRKENIKEIHKELVEKKSTFSESLRWVLIEVGADCDHAQGKSRSLRYLVAAEIPADFLSAYIYGGEKKQLRNEALKILGPYEIDGEQFYLLISFKRFVSWQPPAKLPEIVVLYRLRKIIVDFLLNRYAAWGMRPGITEYIP